MNRAFAEKSLLTEPFMSELPRIADVKQRGQLSRISLIGDFRSKVCGMAKVWQSIEGQAIEIEFVDAEEYAMSFYLDSENASKILAALHRLLLES